MIKAKLEASVKAAATTMNDRSSLPQGPSEGSTHTNTMKSAKPEATATAPTNGAGHGTRRRVAGTLTSTLSIAAETKKLVARTFPWVSPKSSDSSANTRATNHSKSLRSAQAVPTA